MEQQQESIFFSSIRSLFKTLFGTFGIAIAAIPIFILIAAVSGDKGEHFKKNTPVYLPDAEGKINYSSHSAPVILQLNVHGVIGANELTSSIVESQLLESRTGIFSKERVKGILIHINSPGGTVVDSDAIYRLVNAYKKKYKVPVHAYVDGLCASGAMYISCACDYVSATMPSLIGSVGVILGPFFNVTQGLEKIGITSKTFTAGQDKDAMSPFKTWTESDKEAYQPILDFYYKRFVNIVADARSKISKEELMNTYGARVYPAPKAAKLGYVDEGASDYVAALKYLLQAAKIQEKETYQVIGLKPKNKWISDIVRGSESIFKGKIKHIITLEDKERFSSLCSYLYEPGCYISNWE